MKGGRIGIVAGFLLLSSIVMAAVSPHSPSDRTEYLVMRVDGRQLICTGPNPDEIKVFEERRRIRRHRFPDGMQAMVDTYRKRDVEVIFSRNFPEEMEAAVLAAANVWESHLLTVEPIVISVSSEEREEDDDQTLAYARPSLVYCSSWACWPSALENQNVGEDRNKDEADIEITILESDDWYLGVDGKPPWDKYDLLSIVLHEIAHGLGMSSGLAMDLDEDPTEDEDGTTAELWRSAQGGIQIYDQFIWTWEHDWLSDLESPSIELYESLTSRALLWGWSNNTRGAPSRARIAAGGPVLLWTPASYEPGSSVSHLHEHAFPNRSPNSLMTPGIPSGIAQHDPGPIVLGMLYDMGWELKEPGLDLQDVFRCLEGR